MRAIKQFREFIDSGVVKRQSPNILRAKSLIVEAEQDYNYLNELIKTIGIQDRNANDYVKKCYDILMEITRAKLFLGGLNASGNNAHEAEVAYWVNLNFTEYEVQFLDQMRFFRNGMLYYGTILDKEYAEKVIQFTMKNYKKLKKIVEDKIVKF